MGLIEDLSEINRLTCVKLWNVAASGDKKIGVLAPRLIIPTLGSGRPRISEQEARTIYCSVVESCNRYFFSIETPTVQDYQFSGSTPMHARSDLSLYTFNDGFEKVVNVEFKANNPDPDFIRKDIEKLVREQKTGNWFHFLENVDRGTLPSVFGKISSSLQAVTNNSALTSPIVFCFCVLEKKWAAMKCFDPASSSVPLANHLNQFFTLGYQISGGKIVVTNGNGWEWFSG